MSHAAGVGPAFPTEVVRAMLLLRANTLALGHSGCRPLIIDRLLEMLAAGIHPVVPEQGSLGASGDLAPLAHLALPLIGRGEVEFHGQHVPALIALREAGLEPLDARGQGGPGPPQRDPDDVGGRRPRPGRRGSPGADGQRRGGHVASRRCWARTSRSPPPTSSPGRIPARSPWPASCAISCATRRLQTSHHGHAHKVQDPYSLRCVPQVHGAVRDALDYLRGVLADRAEQRHRQPARVPRWRRAPIPDAIATGGGLVISGGNFHGEPIGLALDFAKLAVAELGSISERRTALLVDARLNGGLPPFLATSSGSTRA